MDDLPHFKEDDFRLLFLDIDDVLNSTKTVIVNGMYPFPSTRKEFGSVVDPNGYDVITGAWGTPLGTKGKTVLDSPPVSDVQAFDHVNVKLIDKLCQVTDTHIVLSSSWRLGLDAYQVREMLAYIGLDGNRVLGRTCNGHINWNRGMEIQDFLNELESDMSSLIERGLVTPSLHGKSLKPKSYVIIDDSSDMTDEQLASNFVLVAPREGLSLANVVDAGKLLTHFGFSLYDFSK